VQIYEEIQWIREDRPGGERPSVRQFVCRELRHAVICSIDAIGKAVAGEAGTEIIA